MPPLRAVKAQDQVQISKLEATDLRNLLNEVLDPETEEYSLSDDRIMELASLLTSAIGDGE